MRGKAIMTSADHKAAVHAVAQARRAVGENAWDYRVELGDLIHDPELSFTDRCMRLAARFNASSWVKSSPIGERIHDLVDELKDADDIDHYEAVMHEIYDEADYARVLINSNRS